MKDSDTEDQKVVDGDSLKRAIAGSHLQYLEVFNELSTILKYAGIENPKELGDGPFKQSVETAENDDKSQETTPLEKPAESTIKSLD